MSWLKSFGKFLRELLTLGEKAAAIAEPFVAVAFPEVAPLYISTLGLAMSAEVAYGSETGTGAQKLAQLTQSLLPQAKAWAEKNGIPWDDADIQKWASAVVDTMNLIPAIPATTPASQGNAEPLPTSTT